jgi:CheY-like chemotaxis protein
VVGGGAAAPGPARSSDPAARRSPPPEAAPVATVAAEPVRASQGVPVPDLTGVFDLLEDAEEEVPAPAPRRTPDRGIRVLLVDDEDSLRKVMKDLLVRDGYEVQEARTGAEALDQVDRHAPDIVVLDLNLPGKDGYSVLSELRARPATARLPVIVLTAKGDEDNEVRVFELGADDFLSKPFRAKALSKRLEVVLGRKRA